MNNRYLARDISSVMLSNDVDNDVEPGTVFDGLSAPALKSIIVDAALAGYYTTSDAEDLISFYGLRNV
jgi:hypothetical protein